MPSKAAVTAVIPVVMAVATAVPAARVAVVAVAPAAAPGLAASDRTWVRHLIVSNPYFMYNAFNMNNEKNIKIKYIKEKNVLFIDVSFFSLSVVSAWFDVGSADDPNGKEGLAHLVEHLFMVKTKKYKDKLMCHEALEKRGIIYNAGTLRDASYYYHIQPKEQTKKSMRMLIDGINNSLISSSDLLAEKEIVFNEKQAIEDNPAENIWHLAIENIYKNEERGRNFFGSNKSIDSLNLADCQNFIKNNYKHPLYVIINAGKEKNKLSKLIGDNGVDNERCQRENQNKKITSGVKIKKIKANILQVAVSYRLDGVLSEKEEASLLFIKHFLAGHWSSVLTKKLRLDKKQVYWVDSELVNFKGSNYISFVVSVNKENVKKVIELIKKEMTRLIKDKLTTKKINNFKNIIKVSFLDSISSLVGLMHWYGYNKVLNRPVYSIDEMQKKIDELKPEDIKRVALKFFKDNCLYITVIGDIGKKDLEKVS